MGNNHSKEIFEIHATLPSTPEYWDKMFYKEMGMFEPQGVNGIDCVTGCMMDMDGVPFDKPIFINTLLFENDNKILGVLYHYPQEIISPKSGLLVEKQGAVTILVHPRYRRNGIGSVLLEACLKQKQWRVRTRDQLFTKEGARLWKRVIENI
jgi:hypothetical protein